MSKKKDNIEIKVNTSKKDEDIKHFVEVKKENKKTDLEKHFDHLGIDADRQEALMDLCKTYDIKLSGKDLVVPIRVKDNFIQRMNKIVGSDYIVKRVEKKVEQKKVEKKRSFFYRLLKRFTR